jgi:polysaccharide export outer membrane protein
MRSNNGAHFRAFSWLRATGAALLLTISPLVSSLAFAAYKLQPGDALEFFAVGEPELKQRSIVGVDGDISFILTGAVRAAGLSVGELEQRVRSLVPGKVFRKKGADGRDITTVLMPEQISVAISEYRPFYLNGDVSKPGEHPYRPGITVRHAVAMGGGYDFVKFRISNPALESTDLRGEYNSLNSQLDRDEAVVKRLKAELAGKNDFDGERSSREKSRVELNSADQIERQLLVTRATDADRERVYLKSAVLKGALYVGILSAQQQKEQEGSEDDANELARVKELFQRGQVPITRLIDAKKSILLSATRNLQTRAQLAFTEQKRDEVARQLERYNDDRRATTLKELQDATLMVAKTRARLRAVEEKLSYTTILRSQLVSGKSMAPNVSIFRKNQGAAARALAADESTEVLPGDVIEIALRLPEETN